MKKKRFTAGDARKIDTQCGEREIEVNFFNSSRSNSTAQETLNSISHFFHSLSSP